MQFRLIKFSFQLKYCKFVDFRAYFAIIFTFRLAPINLGKSALSDWETPLAPSWDSEAICLGEDSLVNLSVVLVSTTSKG
jgi:hypothetical protein